MFDPVVMDVIDMAGKVGFIAYLMFPISMIGLARPFSAAYDPIQSLSVGETVAQRLKSAAPKASAGLNC